MLKIKNVLCLTYLTILVSCNSIGQNLSVSGSLPESSYPLRGFSQVSVHPDKLLKMRTSCDLSMRMEIIQAKNLMHGKISKIKHQKKGLFRNIQNNFDATRYHSLVVDRKTFPKTLEITAETKNKTIMGLMHKNYDIHGFQFHPESISTKMGMKLIKNFIAN